MKTQENYQAKSGRKVIEVEAVPYDPKTGKITKTERKWNRSVSLYGWLSAFLLFMINRKLGLVFLIFLLVYQVFPKFQLIKVPRILGKIYGLFQSKKK